MKRIVVVIPILICLAFSAILLSCGDDKEKGDIFTPKTSKEALYGTWELYRMEYFEGGELDTVEAPAISGSLEFSPTQMRMSVSVAHIPLMSEIYTYTIFSNIITVRQPGKTGQSLLEYEFSGSDLILYMGELSGGNLTAAKLYYRRK